MIMKTQKYLSDCRKRVYVTLKKKLPSIKNEPQKLHKAMAYAVLNGGKAIRSAFVYATGESLGAKPTVLNDISAAIEMIHSFTLIHDDLPSLDNADLRRGKPACHKKFDEATAILAGDALQSLAFEILAKIDKKKIPPATESKMIQVLTQAIGSRGLAGGEALDLEMVNRTVSIKKLETMYRLKTGSLLSACFVLAALASNCTNKKTLYHLNKFSEYIGLAFQIHDDIIGIETDTKLLGKKQGADVEMGKPIYPVLAGMKQAKAREKFLYRKAMAHLDKTGINTRKIKKLATFVIERKH